MFGYNPSSYQPRDAYMRAIAEEQLARQQQAQLRRQEQQRARRSYGGVEPSPYGLGYGLNDDEDDYGAYPTTHDFPSHAHSHDAFRDARYRAALEEEMRRERAERQRSQELFRLRQQEEARARAQAELERRAAYEAAMRERELEIQRRRAAAEDKWRIRAEAERQRRREDELRREEAQRQMFERLGLRTRAQDAPRPARSTETQVPYAQSPSMPYGTRARTTSPVRAAAEVHSTSPHAEAPSRVVPTHHTKKYSDEQIAAAETIQGALRARKTRKAAFAALDAFSKTFRELRAGFSPPPVIEFLVDGVATPVPTANVPLPSLAVSFDSDEEQATAPRLAFTPASKPLHAYDEELVRLLGRLDAVESGGDLRVRNRRRALVRRVEGEAVRMERWRGAVWRAYADTLNLPVQHETLVADAAPEDRAEPSTIDLPERSSAEQIIDAATADDSDLFTPGPSAHPTVHIHSDSTSGPTAEPPAEHPVPLHDVTLDSAKSPTDLARASSPLLSTSITTNDSHMEAPLSTDTPAPGGVDGLAAMLAAPAMESAPSEPKPLAERPDEVQPGASLLAPSAELVQAEALPLRNVLGTQHEVDATQLLPVTVQDQADDVSHVTSERDMHRGFGADTMNVPRMDNGVLGQLGRHEEGVAETATVEDGRLVGDDQGVRGAASQLTGPTPPGPVPRGENWEEGEEERALAESTRVEEADNDDFVMVDEQ